MVRNTRHTLRKRYSYYYRTNLLWNKLSLSIREIKVFSELSLLEGANGHNMMNYLIFKQFCNDRQSSLLFLFGVLFLSKPNI